VRRARCQTHHNNDRQFCDGLTSPDEQILDSVVIHDPGGCLTGDVEVDLAAGFATLGSVAPLIPLGVERGGTSNCHPWAGSSGKT
jgi:hypothetical protein